MLLLLMRAAATSPFAFAAATFHAAAAFALHVQLPQCVLLPLRAPAAAAGAFACWCPCMLLPTCMLLSTCILLSLLAGEIGNIMGRQQLHLIQYVAFYFTVSLL